MTASNTATRRGARHLYEDGAPKTAAADRWVELFPETVRVLAALQSLHVTPEQPVFTTTEGPPIEPKAFAARYWYRCLRALGLRVRGIYATKDTFVTTALQVGVKVAWLEAQTGVAYATLKRHYGKWITPEGQSELKRFAPLPPTLFCREEGDNIVPRRRGKRDNRRQPAETARISKCEEGDLNPTPLAKILKVFASPTAKNVPLPPRSVSAGHILGGAGESDLRSRHAGGAAFEVQLGKLIDEGPEDYDPWA
jgi:hypothetical protein